MDSKWPRADLECFYFAHQFRTGYVGGTVCGARSLVRALLEIGAEYPNAALVRLETLGDGRDDDPLRDVPVLEDNIPVRMKVA